MISFHNKLYTNLSSSTKRTAFVRTTYGEYAYYLGVRLGAVAGSGSGTSQNDFVIARTPITVTPPLTAQHGQDSHRSEVIYISIRPSKEMHLASKIA